METFLNPSLSTRTVYYGCCRSLLELSNSTKLYDYFQAYYDAKNISNSTSVILDEPGIEQQQRRIINEESNHHIKQCKEWLQSGGDFINYGLPVIGMILLFINLVQIVLLISDIRKYRKIVDAQSRNSKIKSLVFILSLSLTDAVFGLGAFFYGIFNEKQVTLRDISRILVCGTMSIISVLTMIAITCQRLYIVAKPIKYRTEGSAATIKITVAIWFFSIILAVSYYFAKHKDDVAFDLVLSLIPILTFPAVAVFLFCYLLIWYLLRKQKENVDGCRRIGQEKSILPLAIAIIVAFTLCWLPVSIFGLYKSYRAPDDIVEENRLASIQLYLFSLIVFNSLVNPILYFIFNKKTTSIRNFIRRGQSEITQIPILVINSRDPEEQEANRDTRQ